MRTAIVTGGGTGIGRATAEGLARRGWSVIAAGLERDDGLSDEVSFAECDITDATARAALFASVPVLHGLVNCAGVIRFDDEWTEEGFRKVMDINVGGSFAAANAALPALERGGGAVVNIASMWSWFGNAAAPAYSASKGAVSSMTRSLAVAWGGRRAESTRNSRPGQKRIRYAGPGSRRAYRLAAGRSLPRSPLSSPFCCRTRRPMSTGRSSPSMAATWPPDRDIRVPSLRY